MELILKDMTDGYFSQNDLDIIKKLDSFIPDKVFDAHMHISCSPFYLKTDMSFDSYYSDARVYFGDRKVICNGISTPTDALKTPEGAAAEDAFIINELNKHPENVAEIVVYPTDTVETIEARLTHPSIRGLKCYHIFAKREETFHSYIDEYLPEAAWEVAAKRKMPITLHVVREAALADEGNLKYIIEMTKRYPDATLILAHAARSFAAWTVFDNIDKIAHLENVWYDFSGVCEPTAMAYILKKVGVDRCMWGSDWPVNMSAGKCISIGDTFYWLNENDLRGFNSQTTVRSCLVGTEGLISVNQACKLNDLNADAVESLFYKNGAKLFGVK